jgi:hypothetical protein
VGQGKVFAKHPSSLAANYRDKSNIMGKETDVKHFVAHFSDMGNTFSDFSTA